MLFSDNINIMYVEDDETDIELLRRAMRKNHVQNRLYVAENGVEALRLLREPGTLRLKPCIILLDINMPKMNGFEFLSELRKDPTLSNILVYIFTTSDQVKDISIAHEYNVAGYLVKPTDINEMDQMLISLTQAWQLMRFAVD